MYKGALDPGIYFIEQRKIHNQEMDYRRECESVCALRKSLIHLSEEKSPLKIHTNSPEGNCAFI